MKTDALVIGSDPDAWAAALTLAEAGRSVRLIHPDPVGTCPFDEQAVGAHGAVPGLFHDLPVDPTWIRQVAPELPLAPAPVVHGLGAPQPGDGSAKDLPASPRSSLLRTAARVLRPLSRQEPPPLRGGEPLLPLLGAGLRLRWLGATPAADLLRRATLSLSDLMSELELDGEQAARLALDGLIGAVAGPWSPHQAALWMFRSVTADHFAPSGAALVAALRAAALRKGVVEGRGTLSRVLVDGQGVQAVEVDGSLQFSRLLLLSGDPVRWARLFAPSERPAGLVQELRRFRQTSLLAVARLAFATRPLLRGQTFERARYAPDLVSLEKAFDAALAGTVPRPMPFDLRVWPGPGGGTLATAHLPWAPERPASHREVIEALREGLGALGVEGDLLNIELEVSSDLAARHACGGGSLFQGDLKLDQLWLQRPRLALAQYQTEVPGFWLMGPAFHPGAFCYGASGRAAARAAIEP